MEAKDFMINVGPGGTFRPSGMYHTKPEDVDAIFKRFETEGTKDITVFFHGGLVSEKDGMATATKMAEHFKKSGQAPLCVVWETGLVETVANNLTQIAGGKFYNKLMKVLVKTLSDKLGFDIAGGRGGGVQLTDAELDAELSKPFPFEDFDQPQVKKAARGAATITEMPADEKDLLDTLEADLTYSIQADPEIVEALGEEKFLQASDSTEGGRGIISTGLLVKSAAMIAFNVIKRFVNKRDHDFFPTVVEEILRKLYVAELGAWVWEKMKVKSKEMWQDHAGQVGINQFAGRYLLEQLIAYSKKNPGAIINLVGHSAGSIAICNMLNATAQIDPQFKYKKIVFMAPACRVDLFNKEVISHPERFENFRMYTMTDAFETKDRMVPYFYTHSLLFLVSGILEGEGKEFDSYILGIERHIQGVPPYDKAEELSNTTKFLYEKDRHRLVLSQSDDLAVNGFKTRSITHGGFDDDGPTVESVLHFLKEN